jgi:arginyl-tRNA synthetase
VRDDQGAVCVFFYEADGKPRFKAPDGNELPMIIRKSDGAALYATTDLAALRFRLRELKAERIVYVVGAPQRQHFLMLFATARAAGWIGEGVQVEHVPFGMILGENGKPLKTRTGENVKLRALLDEAVSRARRLVDETDAKRQAEAGYEPISEQEKGRIAEQVGVAAVKYADLSHDRVTDYQFNWEKMLALTGNTAPYMLYAYARIRSIYRKAAERFMDGAASGSAGSGALSIAGLILADPAERGLGLRLARFRETLALVANDLTPHTLCTYLFDLAADFMRFYEACPVVQAADEATRLSRMRLCDLTARTLRLGLRLLGIETLERM